MTTRKTSHPILLEFGSHLRNLRQQHGYSQEDFANEAGLTRGYYGAVECGKQSVSLLTLYNIANALNLPIKELFPAEFPKKVDEQPKDSSEKTE